LQLVNREQLVSAVGIWFVFQIINMF